MEVKDSSAAKAAAPAGPWRPETRLKPTPSGHFRTLAMVNGQPVDFLVDTGATTIALTIEDARRIGLAVDPATFTEVGMGAGGPVRGQDVKIDSVSVGRPRGPGPQRRRAGGAGNVAARAILPQPHQRGADERGRDDPALGAAPARR
jgi:hypothetical protein